MKFYVGAEHNYTIFWKQKKINIEKDENRIPYIEQKHFCVQIYRMIFILLLRTFLNVGSLIDLSKIDL